MSDDFIMLVYMLVYGMFIGVCLLCFGAVLTSSLLSVTQRALTSKPCVGFLTLIIAQKKTAASGE
jgi:uncharacterized membrane protein YdjX (TVP38/TMEM64 family)